MEANNFKTQETKEGLGHHRVDFAGFSWCSWRESGLVEETQTYLLASILSEIIFVH